MGADEGGRGTRAGSQALKLPGSWRVTWLPSNGVVPALPFPGSLKAWPRRAQQLHSLARLGRGAGLGDQVKDQLTGFKS